MPAVRRAGPVPAACSGRRAEAAVGLPSWTAARSGRCPALSCAAFRPALGLAHLCPVPMLLQVWKGGEKVDELVGASKDRLKSMIEKYA